MGVNTYEVSRRDQNFVLYEQLGIERLLETERYKDFSKDDFDLIIAEAETFAKEVIGPLNQDGDRLGVVFEGGEVKVPQAFHDAYKLAREAGWIAPAHSPELGGQGLPYVVYMCISEMFLGACTSFMLYMPGPGVGHLIENFGLDWQRDLFCPKLYSGEWQGTMCLTEPQAGSAVGDIRTKAVRHGDHYLIEGTKCFITSGNHDLTPNIVHAVLARVEGAPPGTKGISLFIVPKYLVEGDGKIGAFNNVVCGSVEHKMGIKASATCVLNFGDGGPCVGYLMGDKENVGMRQMFQMMNEARIATGLQAIALAGAAYENAARYAKERIQGVEIAHMRDPNAPRVPIIKHADVRRMLITQKAYVEAMRAFAYRLAFFVDMAEGSKEEEKRAYYQGMVDLLTPIVKAYCSDKGFEMTSVAMQCFGGYGYCQEYPVEQYCRDSRIAMIYEGTNFIQAADLVGRKLNLQGGVLMQRFIEEINAFVERARAVEEVRELVERLDEAKNTLLETTMKLGEFAMAGEVDYAMLVATRYLHLFGDVVMARELVEQAAIASRKLKDLPEGNADRAFYLGKRYTAEFFVRNILPEVAMKAAVIAAHDRSAIEIPEEAFGL